MIIYMILEVLARGFRVPEAIPIPRPCDISPQNEILEKLKPQKVISAAKYVTKFGYEASLYGNAGELPAQIPLVDATAMSLVWPQDSGVDVHLPPASQPVNPEITSQDRIIKRLIQKAIELNVPIMPQLNRAREFPNFQDLLRESLIQHSERLNRVDFADANFLLYLTTLEPGPNGSLIR
ncbi:hypothetical protein F4782DRAFT_504402 [Xylaria castorea]|nr:hypothetical protein F4782DRAFT_504402 [Xylaria castorea]